MLQFRSVKSNVILIGFSTTGKSDVGRLLADRLGWSFVDTDLWIMGMANKPIHAIFAEDGEGHFRALECEALAKACALDQAVIATGGGAVVASENRVLMQERGYIVLLEATPETILRRLQAIETIEPRPLLAGPDPLGRITELKAHRQALYNELADTVVATDNLSVIEVVEEILNALPRLKPRLQRPGIVVGVKALAGGDR